MLIFSLWLIEGLAHNFCRSGYPVLQLYHTQDIHDLLTAVVVVVPAVAVVEVQGVAALYP